MHTLERTKQIDTRIKQLISEIFNLREELMHNSKSSKDIDVLYLCNLELEYLRSEKKYLKYLSLYCGKYLDNSK